MIEKTYLDYYTGKSDEILDFYKSGECGINIYPDSLTKVCDYGSDMFDGVLLAWQVDWSFAGRVLTLSNVIKNPDVNMYDVVRNSAPNGIPKESGCVK